MNWQERLNNITFEITTGDGKKYTPLWQEAEKNIQYNTEAFNFIGVQGTFVERKERQGRQFPVNLIFQGENHIEISSAFEISANDKRPWKVKHPFYGDLLVQPLSLRIVNTAYNISRIIGILWETITTKFPEDEILPDKTVENLKAETDSQVATSFTTNVPSPSVNLVQPAGNAITNIDKNYKVLAVLEEDIKTLKDLTRTASGAAQNLLNDVDGFINSVISLVNFPFQIAQNLQFKIEKIKNSIDELFDIFDMDNTEEQFLYEAIATTSVTEISRVSVNPEEDNGDYNTRIEVVDAFNLLNDTYNSVLNNYDTIRYKQDAEIALQLDNIVNFSLANLYDIAFEAKQERVIITDKDDNIVNLAHQYFGPGDDNLQIFIDQNNITLPEYLFVRKGREIIYYV
jgi:hypothetical protein